MTAISRGRAGAATIVLVMVGVAAAPAIARADAFADDAAAAYARELRAESSRGNLDRDAALLARARGVFARLVAAAAQERPGTAGWPWQLHSTEDPGIGAYCMAGGEVMLGAPFVRRMALDDAQLAMLLAHEMAHALAGHRRAREVAAASMDSDATAQVDAAAIAAAQEDEADRIGMALAHRAGWPAEALAEFFDKLAALEPAGTFSATHASAAARAERAHRMADSLPR